MLLDELHQSHVEVDRSPAVLTWLASGVIKRLSEMRPFQKEEASRCDVKAAVPCVPREN